MAKNYLGNNEGTIVRPQGRPTASYSIVPTSILQDRSISPRARLVLSYIAGRPEGWIVTVTDIQRQLGITESQWKTTRNELRAAGIVPADHPKRVGGGLNKFTWILDLLLERYYLSTDHPSKIADGSHQRSPMDGKVAAYNQESTNIRKPPPVAAEDSGQVVVVALRQSIRDSVIADGFSLAEADRVCTALVSATANQLELFAAVWAVGKANAKDMVGYAIGLAKRASKQELRAPPVLLAQSPAVELEDAATICAQHASNFGEGTLLGLLGPTDFQAFARGGYYGLLQAAEGGLLPPAQSAKLWQKLDRGELTFHPGR